MKCVGNSKQLRMFGMGYAYALALLLCSYLIAAPKPAAKNYPLIAHNMLIFNTVVHRVLFVPKDEVKDVLLGLIASEKESIIGAHYRVSDTDVIAALIDAVRRKVHVELIIDKGCLTEKHQRIDHLKKNGIIIHVHKTNYLMHNKFFLFQRNLYNKTIIWSGSANMSGVGLKKNCENVVVWENQLDFTMYKQYFELLKKERVVKKK